MEFLKKENKSAAQLAEEIGVQPSGISHILSGRNKPSLDFVIKMLEKYKYISSDWLLFGTGTIYKEASLATLFDENQNFSREKKKSDSFITSDSTENKEQSLIGEQKSASGFKEIVTSRIIRIVWFYENNSFEDFIPARD